MELLYGWMKLEDGKMKSKITKKELPQAKYEVQFTTTTGKTHKEIVKFSTEEIAKQHGENLVGYEYNGGAKIESYSVVQL